LSGGRLTGGWAVADRLPSADSSPRQLPIRALSIWDRYPDIKQALFQMELGYFRRAAFLLDATMQDDRIYGVWETRTNALKAAPVTMKAVRKTAKAMKYAEELQGSDETPGLWEDMVSDAALADLTLWGKNLGIAIAHIDWTGSPNRTTPRLTPWHPQFYRFDWFEFTYKVLTADGTEISMPRVDQNPRSDGEWLVWCPYGFYGGWLRGMIRWLAGKYIMRGWDYRDWARYNEVFGSPITAAFVPDGEDDAVKDEFFSDVRNRGAEGTVMIPVADGETRETAKYGVELIESMGRGTDTFQKFKTELDADIAIGILGQNLTTQVKGGGSLAATKEHTLVRIDVARADAKIAKCIRQQMLSWDAQYNYGDPDLAPRPDIGVDPPEDENAEANTLLIFGQALEALEEGSRDVIDIEAIIQQHGLPMRTPAEIAQRRADKMQQQQDLVRSMGGGAAAGGEDGGPDGGAGGGPAAGPKALSATADPNVTKRYKFQGLPIAVENGSGSIRRWYDESNQETGSTSMRHDYGYVEGALGNDKEQLDVYIGPDPNAEDVHIVHQNKAPDYKSYDEDKVFMGFPTAAAAKEAFLQHRNDPRAFRSMTTIPVERFKATLKRRTTGRKIHARVDVLQSLMALADRHGGRHALRSAPVTVAGKKRAAKYLGQLERNAIAEAARALAPDVAALAKLIENARDLRDLKRGILAAYKDKMSPEQLASVMQRASTLAHLSGRDAAIRQIEP
jgi:phage gp29-like protein